MSEEAIKKALRMIPYGFYSITSKDDDTENAMVANWLTQVSFEPRLVAFGLAKNAYTHKLVSNSKIFGMNMFLQEDSELIMPLTKGHEKAPNKLNEVAYSVSETGVPIIDGAAAYLEIKVNQIVDVGGDHDVIIGEVVSATVLKEGEASDMLTLPGIGWSYAG